MWVPGVKPKTSGLYGEHVYSQTISTAFGSFLHFNIFHCASLCSLFFNFLLGQHIKTQSICKSKKKKKTTDQEHSLKHTLFAKGPEYTT